MKRHKFLPGVMALLMPCLLFVWLSCNDVQRHDQTERIALIPTESLPSDPYSAPLTMLLVPAHPIPGQSFSVITVAQRSLAGIKPDVRHNGTTLPAGSARASNGMPYWRIDHYTAASAGQYVVSIASDSATTTKLSFDVGIPVETVSSRSIWKTERGWDQAYESLYSAWISALFYEAPEGASWSSLHAVMQHPETNFLCNYLGLDEDNESNPLHVIMEPDCADNPFFLRAYFAWKMGLPFGFHQCDHGYVGKTPSPGQWITNEFPTNRNNKVLAFNAFMRRTMDVVHSGTGRTALTSEYSDYYPCALERESLRPGTVFADPYGHTFTLVRYVPQTSESPGVLLAVDAQPDKTIAVKRFWKGNFLFNTEAVVGAPGFKAFRPIMLSGGKAELLKNESLHPGSGFVPYDLQQHKMAAEEFYHSMERVINPKPLNAEAALMNLIKALHEQLLIRVKSVANGEKYMEANPGKIVPMPGNANGIFLTGGLWEEYSTPNRDLRLLIAIDEVLSFPEKVIAYPEDYGLLRTANPEETKIRLQALLEKTVNELTLTYTRTDGSEQKLSLAEILRRRDAFEMAYNPNDGIEIRWGAPEGSPERANCKRQAPAHQKNTMQQVRKWFSQRLHPPT